MELLWEWEIDQCLFQVFNDRPDFPFLEVNQVHGQTIYDSKNYHESLEGDGLLSTKKEDTLAIKTADCLPVALIGNKGAALLHAGWRGFQKGILIEEKLRNLEIHSAIIGPAIQGSSYEVSEEFLDFFPEYPSCFTKNDQKLTFDLPQACEIQLKKHYHEIHIYNCQLDTYSTLGHNSFRRDKTSRRNYNVLKIMRNS